MNDLSPLAFLARTDCPQNERISFEHAIYWNRMFPEQPVSDDSVLIMINCYFSDQSFSGFAENQWCIVCPRTSKYEWKASYREARAFLRKKAQEFKELTGEDL